MQRKRFRRFLKGGFTIMEVLVVISIIVVLLAVVLVLTSRSKAQAEDARTVETLATVRTVAIEDRLTSSNGYEEVCNSGKAFDVMHTLAQQQQLNSEEYSCKSSFAEFAVAFPLKAQEESYWCVDSGGGSGNIGGPLAENPPHNCDHFISTEGEEQGGDEGDGGGEEEGEEGAKGGTGDEGDEGDGGGEEEGENQPPALYLESGTVSVEGGVQKCAGDHCVVTPSTAEADFSVLVSAFDNEDNEVVDVEQDGEAYVYTADIPTDGPEPGQKTILGVGTYEGCTVTSEQITYAATDSVGETATAARTFLHCNELSNPDVEAPEISSVSPAGGSTYGIDDGPIALVASATDDTDVEGVTFRADGAIVGDEDTTATFPDEYSVEWDVTAVTPGDYDITATARDAAGNTTTTPPVTITIESGTPAPRKPLLFSSGFEGTNGTYLNGFIPEACCSYSLTRSTTIKREGLSSMRAEVRSTDPQVGGGWRAEVATVGDYDTGDRWYGWSAYFQSPDSGGVFNGTFGGEYVHWNSYSGGISRLAWRWKENKWNLSTNPSLAVVDHYGLGGPMALTTGQWHDIVVHANWTTGQLEAWLDGTLFYSAPAGSNEVTESPGQYIKLGAVRWGSGISAPTGEHWIIYYDSVRIGDGATGVGYYDVAPGDY